MRYCKKCVQPDTRPGIFFDDTGICGACLFEEKKEKIDWDARWKKLVEITERAKATTKSNYDCVIGVSGGKDSTFQALTARDRLGLKPLLVNGEPEGITDIGGKNIENLKNLGFDVISLRPNPVVIKKLIKRDFYKYLNPIKVTEFPLYASAYIIAHAFRIPLIVQGENPGLTLGVSNTGVGVDGNAMNANKLNTLNTGWENYLGDGVTEGDLFLYHYDREAMEKENIKGVWLGYYVKEWGFSYNAQFAEKYGLTVRPKDFDPCEIGTYIEYSQLDSDSVQVNQLLKHIKFGFGQCTDHACYHIREGLITREEAIKLVREYDGKCGMRYIKKFCDYIEITVEEFWRVANSFRGPMWKKDSKGNWVLKNPIWKQK